MIQSLNPAKCLDLLSNNYIGSLSYIYKNRPYVIPITYFFDRENNRILGYSGKGHKIRALRANNSAAIGVSEIESVNDWKSVLVEGSYREFEGSTAKINLHRFTEGVRHLIHAKEGKDLHFLSEFSSKIYKEGLPIMFKIEIEKITGKERHYA